MCSFAALGLMGIACGGDGSTATGGVGHASNVVTADEIAGVSLFADVGEDSMAIAFVHRYLKDQAIRVGS